ncbi:hypothetical protein AVEN_145852-1 [Araneus ventricosus]|uniref:Uncharacterized protein n=1 Tax=Araneus ventricosus TaxID=182803 RepID=A0A4Y2VPN7_ARAVE|nr:hypothetical protein AVEN_145852-1 [Araneus ventricosus]
MIQVSYDTVNQTDTVPGFGCSSRFRRSMRIMEVHGSFWFQHDGGGGTRNKEAKKSVYPEGGLSWRLGTSDINERNLVWGLNTKLLDLYQPAAAIHPPLCGLSIFGLTLWKFAYKVFALDNGEIGPAVHTISA